MNSKTVTFGAALVVIAAALIQESECACENIAPSSDWQPKNIVGYKNYVIAQMKAYPFQDNLATCGDVVARPYKNDANNWAFSFVYQKDKRFTILMASGTMGPNGQWDVDLVLEDGSHTKFTMSSICSKAGKWSVLYSCNKDTGNPAVMILSSKRNGSGIKSLDSDDQKAVQDCLSKNKLDGNLEDTVQGNKCARL